MKLFVSHQGVNCYDKLEYEKIKSYYVTLDHSDKIRKKHEQKYPDHWKVFGMSGKIGCKWSVLLNFYFSKKEITMEPFINNEPVWVGRPPFETYTTYNASIHYPELKWLPYPNPFNKKPLLADINEFVTPGFNYSGRWIPVLIDVSRLNNSDEKKIKKLVWAIVKMNLQKEEDKSPYDEHRELAFLYKIKENKFQRYLKWYDLHHNEGLPFRTIALYDTFEKKCPDRFEEAKEKLKERTKTINTGKGQRVLRGVIGVPVKGEDAVEKAIKIIYSAIHRKPCPSKLKKKTSFDCPEHKQSCPENCDYLKKWMEDFNRRNWKPPVKTLTDVDLDGDIIDNSGNVLRPITSTRKRKNSNNKD